MPPPAPTPDRLEAALFGLLVGDALGVPYEFTPASHIPRAEAIEMVPPAGFDRAHASVPPGTWSDDGAHALCLLASLLHAGRLDVEDLGRRLVNWYEHGYLAVDANVFDVGIQTSRALRAIREGNPALDAGGDDVHGNGNGSLMRVLPLALWHRGGDTELVRDARLQSRVTHGHLRSQLCCALYCLWARAHLEDRPDPWGSAVARLRAALAADEPALSELEDHVRPDDPPSGTGSGYVVDCLRSARLVLASGSYEQVVKAAIALGDDTDTTAAVAGGIAGLRDGLDAIPRRWRDALRGGDLLAPLLEGLRHNGS